MSNNCAVILAGGKGTRLRPYTIAMPKPLVPVGDVPILEIIIRQLSKNNFERIIITVNHQADIIKAYFGDGSKWGVSIEYSMENTPLGTMGPLTLLENLPDDFLVMNGDILTDLKYEEFLNKHIEANNEFTICSHERAHKVDYGVLVLDDNGHLKDFEEKPVLPYHVSMGIYAVNRSVVSLIPQNEYYGFDSLMRKMIVEHRKVAVKSFQGYWLDIGRPDDYMKAIEDFEEMKGCFL